VNVTLSETELQFHAYILGGFLNIRWNVDTMRNQDLCSIVKGYLAHAYGDQQWPCLKLLNAIRDRSRNEIKEESKRKLPSLFTQRASWPLAQPKEAPKAKFDVDYIYQLKEKVENIRRDDTMNNQNDQGDTVAANKPPRLHLPAGVDVSSLTIDNFRSMTGRRFRVTTEQQNRIKAGTLTREQAFQDFVNEVVKGGGS